MTDSDFRANLHQYLRRGREAMVWKLDGLSEYDARRPLTPTGTNLLGLVKHLAGVEIGYFAETFARPFADPPAWLVNLDGAEPNVDLWATAEESRAQILELYRRACAHADTTIEALELDAPGRVPWWPAERAQVSLHQILVHVIAETSRHAGHADIVRELVDGVTGVRPDSANLPPVDQDWWDRYRAKLEQVAREA